MCVPAPVLVVGSLGANAQRHRQRTKLPRADCDCASASCAREDDGSPCHVPCCTACFATKAPLPRRYHNNVYHQAELVYAMAEAELTRSASNPRPSLRTIYWRMPLLNWSGAMLRTLLPRAQLVLGAPRNGSSVPPGCRLFGVTPAGTYFKRNQSAALVRERAWRACGLPSRVAARPALRALVMPRAGSGLQSSGWRNFAAQAELVETLRTKVVGPRGGDVSVVATPGGEVPLCDQIRLWAEADLVLTPNGAHFVNAPFMAAGAALVEGVTWAMRGYTGQLQITRHSGLHHVRLHSTRPPSKPVLGRFAKLSEEECAKEEACQHRFRDRSFIHAGPGMMLKAVAEAEAEAPSPPPASPLVADDGGGGSGGGGGRAAGGGRARRGGGGSGSAKKAAAAAAKSKGSPPSTAATMVCTDEPATWLNPFGRSCADYGRQMAPSSASDRSPGTGGWCEGGRLKPGAAWAGGEMFDWPEKHCCVCGGGKLGPPPPSTKPQSKAASTAGGKGKGGGGLAGVRPDGVVARGGNSRSRPRREKKTWRDITFGSLWS